MMARAQPQSRASGVAARHWWKTGFPGGKTIFAVMGSRFCQKAVLKV
jgi:hypothetical protein